MSNQLDIEAIRTVIMENAEAVEYRPDHHQYFFDGVEVPSVSRLERPITDEELRNIPADRLEMARQRGTLVHDNIDKYLSTGFDLSKGDYRAYMAQFKRFMKDHKVIVIAHEVKLRNVIWCYAGRTDLVAIIDDEPFMRPIDYKATYEINPSVCIQLMLYENCLLSYRLNGQPLPVEEGKILHLTPDDYKLVPASEVADRDITVATARGLVSVNTFKTRYVKKK